MLKSIKLGIVGSRTIKNYKLLIELINLFPYQISLIISGGAHGVDRLARIYSIQNAIPLKEFLPDWEKFGKQASIYRNRDIVLSSDYVLILWNGISPGTSQDIKLCKYYKKPYYLYNIKDLYRIYNIGIPDKTNCKDETGFKTWVGMLKRVTTSKSYTNVKIDPSWLMFSQFLQWYILLNKIPGYELDKDLLSEGTHNHYGPDVCTYLPKEINQQLQRKKGYLKINNYYVPCISKGGTLEKGIKCTNITDARNEYLRMKREYMEELVNKYYLTLSTETKEKLLNYNFE